MTNDSQNPAAVVGPPVAQPVLTPLTASAIILVVNVQEGVVPLDRDSASAEDLAAAAAVHDIRVP